MALEDGKKLGPYEIISAAGAGGMGEVYKAKDTRLDRTVAIKILPSSVAGNPDLKQRFEREAKAISSLSHPNICTLYDIGIEEGIDFLVMEFIEGETLADRLKREPLSNREIFDTAIQIADALDSAHRKGLVHRDLKPANVMLTRDGAKLLDFGLAKIQIASGLSDDISAITITTPLTGTGTILGTVPYMSPEQLEGKDADSRSDIFSFGSVLYEMATGQRPFDGGSQASLIASILKEDPASIAKVQPLAPPLLDRAVQQCLEKDPDKRWQSAGDLKRALEWIAEGGSQAGIPITVSKKRKLQQRVSSVIIALFGVAILLLGYLYYSEISKPLQVTKTNIELKAGSKLGDFGGGHLAISHDGTRIAYVAADSGSTEQILWVRSLSGLTPIPLQGTEKAWGPVWSHDDRYIAFFSDRKLMKVLANGGPVHTLIEGVNGREGDWNQYDQIIFTPDANGPMHIISAAGGQSTPIMEVDSTNGEATHRWGCFLPDGENFLFFVRVDNSDDDGIWLGNINTGERRLLFHANSNAMFSSGHILYCYNSNIMAVPFDDGSLEITGEPYPIVENVTYLPNWSRGVFSVSNNGRLIYRNGFVGNGTTILLYDIMGNLVDTIDTSGDHYRLEFFPDNKRIAMDLEESNQTGTDIWVADIERKTRTRITFDEKADGFPMISPDGKLIAFKSMRGEKNAIYIKPADGTGSAKLFREFDFIIWPHEWVGDGSGLISEVISNSGGGAEIWFFPLDTTKELRPLLQYPEDQYDATVSPDGRWLAYGSNETGDEQIYVTSYPSLEGRWQVTSNEGDRPHWNQDSKSLYYLDNNDVIHRVAVDGTQNAFKIGHAEALFPIENGFRPGDVYDISSDGQHVLVNSRPSTVTTGSIVLIQNWVAEFQK